MKKRVTVGVVLLAIALLMAACGGEENASPSASPSASPTTSADRAGAGDEAQATVYPLTVQDATGQSFTFDRAPEKIVSTSPAETEMLFALGLGERIVGVSDYDNYPEEAKSKPKVGSITQPNAEAIVAAGADLVVTGISIDETARDNLRQLGLTVFCTDPNTVDDVLDGILLLGRITDKQAEAGALVAQMRADIEAVRDAAATLKPEDKKKVYIEFSPGYTVGSGEFMDELITIAGGVNIASDVPGWSLIDEEKVIADDPDVILYTLNVTDSQGNKLEDLIRGRSGWSEIRAIRDGRVVGLDADVLARPGPRITQALLDISEAIYPGLVRR